MREWERTSTPVFFGKGIVEQQGDCMILSVWQWVSMEFLNFKEKKKRERTTHFLLSVGSWWWACDVFTTTTTTTTTTTINNNHNNNHSTNTKNNNHNMELEIKIDSNIRWVRETIRFSRPARTIRDVSIYLRDRKAECSVHLQQLDTWRTLSLGVRQKDSRSQSNSNNSEREREREFGRRESIVEWKQRKKGRNERRRQEHWVITTRTVNQPEEGLPVESKGIEGHCSEPS